MKYLLYFFCVVLSYASVLHPIQTLEAEGNVVALSLHKDKLIAGTDNGILEVFDTKNSQKIFETKFAKIKDFMGDEIAPKVFCVDYDALSNSYLAVIQAGSGARELVFIQGKEQRKLLDKSKKLYISQAKFANDGKVLVALLSNELILLDIKSLKQIYRFQVNHSHFSDLKVDKNRIYALDGCESGILSYIDINNGKILKVLKGANVDNTYKVDLKNGYALGAGQDRRGSVYNIQEGSYKIFEASFLIYAGALSPSAKFAAFSFNENNDIAVFDVANEQKLYMLKGQKSTLNSIVFNGEKEIFSASDDKYILRWRLP